MAVAFALVADSGCKTEKGKEPASVRARAAQLLARLALCGQRPKKAHGLSTPETEREHRLYKAL